MDILPKSSEEFTSQRYWDAFFSKRKEDPFEWYGEYPELSSLLHKYVTPKDNLLIVGCGNSTLSADLFMTGIKNQKSIDISTVVINQMKTRYPELEFIEGDVTKMTFEDDIFTCILDKGTFDALSPPPPASSSRNRNKTEFVEEEEAAGDKGDDKLKVDLMLEEIKRVIKPGGRFVCISLLQPHVASKLILAFHSSGWMTRVVRCTEAEEKTASRTDRDQKAIIFPVFMTIFTKLKSCPGMTPILEAGSPSDPSILKRFSTLEDLHDFIKEQQNFALVRRGLQQLGFCAEKGIQLPLTNIKTNQDRFILNIVDVPRLMNNPALQKFGVFIVPQGRETEWLFGTHQGRTSLAMQANFARLVVVHLIRGQSYESMDSIQDELGGVLSSLYPAGIAGKEAPIMTLGNDVGDRSIVFQGHSEFSGDFVVEDVKCDGEILRRLIFLNNPNVIQSEVEMKTVKKRGKEFRNPITDQLSCNHHSLMTLSFPMLRYFFEEGSDSNVKCLLIGLGGGLLPSFLVGYLPNILLTVVEIDPEIVKIAKAHFGLPTSDKLITIVDDGLKFIETTDSQYDIILLDVDNKSTEEGLSCPPPSFLEKSSLANFKARMTSSRSVLVVNLVCRNQELKKGYLNILQEIFPFVLLYDVPSEVNTLVFCFLSAPSCTKRDVGSFITKSVNSLVNGQKQKNEKKKEKKGEKNTSDTFSGSFDDVQSLVKDFKVLKL